MRKIWSGEGSLEDGDVFWTKTRDETLVGRRYVVAEIRKRLGSDGFFRQLTADGREELLAEVGSDDFLRGRAFETVGSVVRAAKDRALDYVIAEMGSEVDE